MSDRQLIPSTSHWARIAGYSRAVRIGTALTISGTTANDEQGQTVSVGDAYGQAVYILQKIQRVLAEAGARFEDVTRTRIYVTRYDDWEPAARAHGEVFKDIRPANTLVVVSSLVPADALVEIEIDAVIA
ncbi:MAG: RidA family protein [Chloroflexi bacterium]|nr:RidA family protein [Chloroflexota bacterium]